MAQTLKLTLLMLAGLLLSGCGTTGHVAMMHDFGGDADTLGQNPVCTFEIKRAVSERIQARYMHQSWCFTNFPFNDNPESTLDAVGFEAQIW